MGKFIYTTINNETTVTEKIINLAQNDNVESLLSYDETQYGYERSLTESGHEYDIYKITNITQTDGLSLIYTITNDVINRLFAFMLQTNILKFSFQIRFKLPIHGPK